MIARCCFQTDRGRSSGPKLKANSGTGKQERPKSEERPQSKERRQSNERHKSKKSKKSKSKERHKSESKEDHKSQSHSERTSQKKKGGTNGDLVTIIDPSTHRQERGEDPGRKRRSSSGDFVGGPELQSANDNDGASEHKDRHTEKGHHMLREHDGEIYQVASNHCTLCPFSVWKYRQDVDHEMMLLVFFYFICI